MIGCVSNRGVAGEIQDVTFKDSGVPTVFIGKPDLHLSHDPARLALNPLDREFDDHLLAPYGQTGEPPVQDTTTYHLSGFALRTLQGAGILRNSEEHPASSVHSALISVADNPPTVIQKTRGHAWTSFSDFQNPKKEQACPLSFCNQKVRTYRKSRNEISLAGLIRRNKITQPLGSAGQPRAEKAFLRQGQALKITRRC
jgi:hypothetical protein